MVGRKSTSSAGAVRTDIGEALALLAQQPGIGVAYKKRGKAENVRRILLSRMRYFIYYRVTSETVEVLALWHMSRGKQPLL